MATASMDSACPRLPFLPCHFDRSCRRRRLRVEKPASLPPSRPKVPPNAHLQLGTTVPLQLSFCAAAKNPVFSSVKPKTCTNHTNQYTSALQKISPQTAILKKRQKEILSNARGSGGPDLTPLDPRLCAKMTGVSSQTGSSAHSLRFQEPGM